MSVKLIVGAVAGCLSVAYLALLQHKSIITISIIICSQRFICIYKIRLKNVYIHIYYEPYIYIMSKIVIAIF